MGEMFRSVAMVVTTFDRRSKLLEMMTAASQADLAPTHVVVIDNDPHNNPGLHEELRLVLGQAPETITLTYLPQAENLGSSGGFRKGISFAAKLGVDLVWVMDDDAVPESSTLATLVAALVNARRYDRNCEFAASKVLWLDGSPHQMNQPLLQPARRAESLAGAHYPILRSCSFVSLAVTPRAVEQVGLPIAQFFIWYDDVEYTMRLASAFSGIYVPESVVVHATPTNAGSNFRMVDDENAWKFRCGLRNGVAAELAMVRPARAAKHLRNLFFLWGARKASWQTKVQVTRSLGEVPSMVKTIRNEVARNRK